MEAAEVAPSRQEEVLQYQKSCQQAYTLYPNSRAKQAQISVRAES